MEADKVTIAHLFKNEGFQFIIMLFTAELSHFIIITLQFLVFYLNTKQHDLLFVSVQCFSQQRQYKMIPLKLVPVGCLEKGKVWGKLCSVLRQSRDWTAPEVPVFSLLQARSNNTTLLAELHNHKLCRGTANVCVCVRENMFCFPISLQQQFTAVLTWTMWTLHINKFSSVCCHPQYKKVAMQSELRPFVKRNSLTFW